MTGYERIRAHLAGESVDHLPLMPITMMLAADQTKAAYRDYVTDYRVLCEAQIRTAEAFSLDYVSAISDPTREAADCGAAIRFFEDQPPAIREDAPLLADKSRLAGLTMPDPHGGGRMTDRLRGVAMLRERVGGDKLVEGWIEGPCAEAADLRGLNPLMLDFMDDATFVTDLLDFVTEMEIDFARAQVEAGADLIGMGDAAASLAGPRIYEQFILPRERRIVDAVHDTGVPLRLHICGDTRPLFAQMGTLGCDIIDLDSMCPLDDARRQMGPEQVLLGNLDPVQALKNSDPELIAAAVAACHAAAGPRYIVGAGCEVPRGTPPENFHALCRYALDRRAEDVPDAAPAG